MSEYREDQNILPLLHKLVQLAQERNTLALGSLEELRDIHKGIDSLVAALPQPNQLKSQQMIFGTPI